MAQLLVVFGSNTTIHSAPLAVFAPVDVGAKVKNAILVEGPTADFHLWQDITYYFTVDPLLAAICQRPGVDLSHSKILVLLE